MMRKTSAVLGLLLFVAIGLQAASVGQYRSEALHQLATSLRLVADSIPEGYSSKTIDGNPLSLVKQDGMVAHIGYRLFGDSVRSSSRGDVLNFLERYFLQLMYPGVRTQSQMHRDYKTSFTKGGISDVKRILPDDAFSLNIESGKYGVATWSREGKPYLVFSFPMDYTLLSSEDKLEAEAGFESDLMKAPSKPELPPSPDVSVLTPTRQRDFMILKGNPYIDKRLNSDTYYQIIEDRPVLVLDITHPAESSANMMLNAATGGDFTLDVKQTLYGYKQALFQVSLSQWLSFCQSQGCQLYFGVEKVLSTEVRASVIAVNEMEGYNHVMFVRIPLKAIDDQKGVIVAQVHAYVPMHNVANLFEKYRKNRNKEPKIYER